MLPLALSAISAGASLISAFGQSSAQRRQTDEQVRRMQAQAAQTVGTTQAAGAASGIEFDSNSLQAHLAAMKAEFERQATWTRRAGYAAADATAISGVLGAGGDLGGSLFRFGAANNWFKTPTVK
jgi:hypothetical protein